VYEVRTAGKLAGQVARVVVLAGTERPGTEGEPVMRIVHGMEKPCDILFIGDDARQPEHLERRVIGMHAQV